MLDSYSTQSHYLKWGWMMGRRRGFLPPAHCEQCGKPTDLGYTLWPGDQWRCIACLENPLPGKDATTKSLRNYLNGPISSQYSVYQSRTGMFLPRVQLLLGR